MSVFLNSEADNSTGLAKIAKKKLEYHRGNKDNLTSKKFGCKRCKEEQVENCGHNGFCVRANDPRSSAGSESDSVK